MRARRVGSTKFEVGRTSRKLLVGQAWLFFLAAASRAATLYVDVNSGSPTPPYATWATAARAIQDAVDASVAGDEIVVTNGVYKTGGRVVAGYKYTVGYWPTPMTITNRVAVDKPLMVRSVNGPQFTLIEGYQVPGTTFGDGAIRCLYITNGAILSGFTLTNGATHDEALVSDNDHGGGAFGELDQGGKLSNCILVNNAASAGGGGAYQVNLDNCLVISNTCPRLESSYGIGGGGVQGGTLKNCTVVGNAGGGALGWYYMHSGIPCALYNSIIYYNQNGDVVGNVGSPYFCCTPDSFLYFTGNITNEPLFLNLALGNLRLQPGSPCINAGNNAYVATATDLEGNPRIVNGTVDMGAYEFQGSSGLTGFHAWLAQYGLPTDGSADYADPDRDGMNNWQEWIAGTNPTNAASVLRLLTPAAAGSNVTVSWQSVLGIGYFVQFATNLNTPGGFCPLITNLPGQSGATSFTDTNAAGTGERFYRVGVGN